MQKHICDLTGKDIPQEAVNYGRSPLVVDLGKGLSAHLQFVQDHRVNQSDIHGAALGDVLDKFRAAVPELGTKGGK